VRHMERSSKWGIGLAVAALCGPASAQPAAPPAPVAAPPPPAAPPHGAAVPPPPVAAPPAAPVPVAAPPAAAPPDGPAPAAPPPAAGPEWSPPSDGTKSGDGSLHDAPLFAPSGEPRHFTVTWNPLTLFVVRAELSVEAMLTDHHVIQLTGFYGSTTTNTDSDNNVFRGWGGELGYRWYSGTGGPRGLYVAPSFLLAHYTAIPMTGAEVPYWNLGGALDVGWQAILADRWVAGLGGGLQYTVPTHTFPAQELPASVYSTRGLRPRVLLGLGVAFD
jgi:Protein of unknown function (DUF3575)